MTNLHSPAEAELAAARHRIDAASEDMAVARVKLLNEAFREVEKLRSHPDCPPTALVLTGAGLMYVRIDRTAVRSMQTDRLWITQREEGE